MKNTARIFSITLIFFLGVLTALPFNRALAQETPDAQPQQAQPDVRTDYTEEELKLFLKANQNAAQVQQAAEQKMIQAIEETDMDINRFNEIASAQQNPQADTDISDEEMTTFTEAAQKVMEVQRETQAEVAEAVEEAGMDFTEYRQIIMAYQSSPEVQQKITELMEEQNQEQNN
jgi:hypothetical protein